MFLLILGVAIVLLLILFLVTYKVIEPNEAHVLTIMGGGRKVFSPRDIKNSQGQIISKKKTAYFYVPFLMKQMILPLGNVKMEINDIHLNDMKVAPFICDVITWVNIQNPIMASERLSDGKNKFDSLKEDLINIVQAVARATSMKQEILDILRDRETFSEAVTKEVEPLLQEWGVKLVNLEVNDIRDDESKESHVINDYESIRKAQVSSTARQETAIREKEAVLIEQENFKESAVATAEAEKKSQLARIQKEQAIEISNQEKEKATALSAEKANVQKIEAHRVLEVGKADVAKEAEIQKSKGESEAIRIKGEKEAEVVRLKGLADADATQAKGLAEAKATDANAEALKKYNEAGISLEKLKAIIEIAKAKWLAYAQVAENANIKIVNSGKGADIFGIPMNAETGADLGQMIDGLDLSKLNLDKVKDVFKKDKNENKESSKEQTKRVEDLPF